MIESLFRRPPYGYCLTIEHQRPLPAHGTKYRSVQKYSKTTQTAVAGAGFVEKNEKGLAARRSAHQLAKLTELSFMLGLEHKQSSLLWWIDSGLQETTCESKYADLRDCCLDMEAV